jgi:fatty acid desaturase
MSIRPSLRANADYADLKRLVVARGLLNPQPFYYFLKSVIALGMVGAAVAVAVLVSNPIIVLLDAVFLAFASTQVALLAHDVGHRQGYRGRRTNLIGRYFFGNLMLGVSHTWWSTKHNQHHATPNHLEKDPDILFPFVVFSPEQIASKKRFLRPLIAIQAFVFVTVLPLQAANMRVSSIQHLFSPAARQSVLQGLLISTHFALYGLLLFSLGSWPLALGFFAVHQGVFGLYNSSVFASNHKGMTVISEGESRLDFLREQVTTSRNVHGRALTDFWYGGLNYQIEHHLFPTMARNRLAEAQRIVKAFCDERGVPYHATGLFASYREGFSHLHRASASLRNGTAA